jgi:hypothetical protein
LLGAVALLCGSLALPCASVNLLGFLTVPLCVAGLLLGLVGIMVWVATEKGSLLWPVAAVAVNVPILVLASLWPTFLGGRLRDPPPAPDPFAGKTLKVALGTGAERADLVPVEESEWADASRTALQQDGVRVRILSATTGPIEVSAAKGGQPTTERYLTVVIRLQNLAPARRVEHTSWGQPPGGEEPPRVVLRDNQAREYRPRRLPLGRNPARFVLTPAKTAEDTLYFEVPPSGIEYLRLELAARNWGGTGRLRFELPRSFLIAR